MALELAAPMDLVTGTWIGRWGVVLEGRRQEQKSEKEDICAYLDLLGPTGLLRALPWRAFSESPCVPGTVLLLSALSSSSLGT